jgi:tRNA(fMet)-specific endonuclease VapC
MSGNYLLDTNIIVALFANDTAVTNRLASDVTVFVPSIGLGELYYGAQKSSRLKDNLAQVDNFVVMSTVLSCDAETASWYGEIRNKLRQKGRPIPENDIWISAIAFQHDLILVTRDAHFSEIENLKIEQW